MRGLALSLLLTCTTISASAAGRMIETTGVLTAGERTLRAGDELPNSEVRLASGTATLAIKGGRFLLKGPARLTPRKTSFRLNLGSLLSVLKHSADRRFSVRTPSAVASVRGTDFFVKVDARRSVDICICKGAIEVTAKGMKKLPLASQHHLNYRFWSVKSDTVHEEAHMSDHSDEELDILRSLLAAEKP